MKLRLFLLLLWLVASSQITISQGDDGDDGDEGDEDEIEVDISCLESKTCFITLLFEEDEWKYAVDMGLKSCPFSSYDDYIRHVNVIPDARQYIPENEESIYNQLGCYFDGETGATIRYEQEPVPSSSFTLSWSSLLPPNVTSYAVLSTVDEIFIGVYESVRDYVLLIEGRFDRIHQILQTLKYITVDDIKRFMERKNVAEKFEYFSTHDQLPLVVVVGCAVFIVAVTAMYMVNKRRKYSNINILASINEADNTPLPKSGQNATGSALELRLDTNVRENTRQPFGYNATKAFTMSTPNSIPNSRGFSPTSTIASADDGSTILTEGAYKMKRPGTNLKSKQTAMFESVKYPAVLVGWQISVAAQVGIVLSAEKNVFRSTVYRVQFSDGSTRTLALKRSSKKGKVPFELIRKMN